MTGYNLALTRPVDGRLAINGRRQFGILCHGDGRNKGGFGSLRRIDERSPRLSSCSSRSVDVEDDGSDDLLPLGRRAEEHLLLSRTASLYSVNSNIISLLVAAGTSSSYIRDTSAICLTLTCS